ncbi:putative mitochondrial protein [Glycine soja]
MANSHHWTFLTHFNKSTPKVHNSTIPRIGLTHKNGPQWSRQLSQRALRGRARARLTGALSKGGKVDKSGAFAPTYPPLERKSDLRSSYLCVNQKDRGEACRPARPGEQGCFLQKQQPSGGTFWKAQLSKKLRKLTDCAKTPLFDFRHITEFHESRKPASFRFLRRLRTSFIVRQRTSTFGMLQKLTDCVTILPFDFRHLWKNPWEMAFKSFELVSNASVESLPMRPCMSDVVMMVARVMLGHEYEPRMGLGKNNNGVASLVKFKENRERFGLGYKPTRADVKRGALEKRSRGMGQHQRPQAGGVKNLTMSPVKVLIPRTLTSILNDFRRSYGNLRIAQNTSFQFPSHYGISRIAQACFLLISDTSRDFIHCATKDAKCPEATNQSFRRSYENLRIAQNTSFRFPSHYGISRIAQACFLLISDTSRDFIHCATKDAKCPEATNQRHWAPLVTPMAKFDPKIVMEFYANAWPTEEGVHDMRSWVRGQWIPFDADALSQFLGHPLILAEGQQCKYGQRRRQVSGFDEEAIAQLLCILGQDFTRNILPSDHNFDLPLPKCQLVYAILTQLISDAIYQFASVAPARHPMDPKKSNWALGFPALITGLYQFYRQARSTAPPGRRRARHHSSPETTSHRQLMHHRQPWSPPQLTYGGLSAAYDMWLTSRQPTTGSSFRAQNFMLFASSPFIHLFLPPSSYPWPLMVKQRNPLMKKILGLQSPMELTSCEMKRGKHASYSSHDSCKSLGEKLSDYYRGRHSLHTKHHSQRREKDRSPQEVNISLPYFHGKDNVEAYLDWEMKQQLKRKPSSKSYGSHSYLRKDQAHGILGAAPSKPKEDKGKTIEKYTPKTSSQERTSNIKCFKCRGRGHIASQCPTKKTMIMRGQDIYSSQEETTSSPSSSGSEDEVRGEESSEEVYPHEEGDLLMVRKLLGVSKLNLTIIPYSKPYKLQWLNEQGEMIVNQQVKVPFSIGTYKDEVNCDIVANDQLTMKDKRDEEEKLENQKKKKDSKALFSKAKGKEKEEKDSSKKIVKKENHFATKCDIKRALLKQSFYLLLSRETSLSTAIPLVLEVIPQVKELLDEGLVHKSLNPCALLVPKIRLPMDPKRIKVILEWPTPPCIREIWGFNDLTNCYKRFVPYFSIFVAPLIELVRKYILSWEDGQERDFQSLPYSNIPNITNTYVFIRFTCVEERIPEFQEPLDLRIYTLREFPERFSKDRIRFPTSRVQSCWMTSPLDGPISCFLIKVDPWVLVHITFRGPYVLAIRGLHALAFRGLRVLIFSVLHIHTLGEYKMLNRDLCSRSFLLSVPRPPPDIGGRPTVRAHPEREAIMHLLCILGQVFPRAAAKRRVRTMRTNMTTLTWMTLLFSNILPSDHNANLPLQMYQLVSMHLAQLISDVIYYLQGSRPQDTQWTRRSPTGPWGFQLWLQASVSPTGCPFPQQGIAPARHPVDPKKSNRVLELPALITGLCQFYGVHVAPSKVIRPLTNRAFIKKYCTPMQAQGETPQQPGDGRKWATDAPPPPLEFTLAHPRKG